MRLSRLVTGIVAACAAVLMSAGPGAAGQMAQGTEQAATAKAKPQAGMGADMSARCQAMMADHEKMMAELKAADERLDALVSKMNAAPATGQAAATAAVVNEMVDPAPDDAGRHDEDGARPDGPHDGAHAGRQGRHGDVPHDEADGRYEAHGRHEALSRSGHRRGGVAGVTPSRGGPLRKGAYCLRMVAPLPSLNPTLGQLAGMSNQHEPRPLNGGIRAVLETQAALVERAGGIARWGRPLLICPVSRPCLGVRRVSRRVPGARNRVA